MVNGKFEFGGRPYLLRITDPIIRAKFLTEDDGDYSYGDAFLTVSLAEPFDDGYAYKLIAGVIQGGVKHVPMQYCLHDRAFHT